MMKNQYQNNLMGRCWYRQRTLPFLKEPKDAKRFSVFCIQALRPCLTFQQTNESAQSCASSANSLTSKLLEQSVCDTIFVITITQTLTPNSFISATSQTSTNDSMERTHRIIQCKVSNQRKHQNSDQTENRFLWIWFQRNTKAQKTRISLNKIFTGSSLSNYEFSRNMLKTQKIKHCATAPNKSPKETRKY